MRKIIAIGFLLLLLHACRKDDFKNGATIYIPTYENMTATVMHHWWNVPNCRIYITKSSAATFPGRNPALYDSSKTADGAGTQVFYHLPNGKYWFYAEGIDVNLIDTVWGYIPFTVDLKTGQTQEEEITIPVSE